MNRWLVAARTFAVLPVLTGTVLAPAVAHAEAILGVQVAGSAREIGVTCSGCPISVTNFPSSTDGGAGSTSAAVSLGVSFEEDLPGVDGPVAYLATAALNGPISLPTLGALAAADIIVDVAQLTTFFHNATANAQATQRYFYTGLGSTTYTLAYEIVGQLEGGPFSELFGGFSVFGSGFDPGNEIQPLLGDDFGGVRGEPGIILDVSVTGSVTFDVAPFDTVFVVAQLLARANSLDESRAVVEAANTLSMRFTAGDTTLLSPVLVSQGPGPGAPGPGVGSPVPQPASILLAGAGLAMIGFQRWGFCRWRRSRPAGWRRPRPSR